jgi:coenzyme Q-binding protein COQ10
MGTGLFNKRFTTVAKLDRPHRIEISSRDPIFERYEQIWTFAGNGQGGTDIHCEVDLEFGSRVMQLLIGPSVGERTKAMVQAYIREAQRLYRKT